MKDMSTAKKEHQFPKKGLRTTVKAAKAIVTVIVFASISTPYLTLKAPTI